MKKRSRIDIYADILETLKRRPEGVLVTRISYGAGLPLDRIKPMLETLVHFELVNIRAIGLPLQANMTQRRFYCISRKGLEFLDAYRRIQELITYLESDITKSPAASDFKKFIPYMGNERP